MARWHNINKDKKRRYRFTKKEKDELRAELLGLGFSGAIIGASVANIEDNVQIMGSTLPYGFAGAGAGAIFVRNLSALYHTLRNHNITHKQALKEVRRQGKLIKKK